MSSFEAYGMTVGEALAAGTPAVVRERGALEDWVKQYNCTGIASTDPEPIATAVIKTINNESSIESLPTWSDVVDKIETRYENLL
jgi:glycosyltransferase involved in cell wall biosynthesis